MEKDKQKAQQEQESAKESGFGQHPLDGAFEGASSPPPSVQLKSSGAPIQRRLVHSTGAPMTAMEIAALKAQKPGNDSAIDVAQADAKDLVPNVTRSGVNFSEFRPASSSSWRWSMPDGHHTSHGGDSVYGAAKSEGLGMGLKRTPLKGPITGSILENQDLTGAKFRGADALESGKGMKESGLARTHHTGDSSVRAIIEYLHKDRSWTKSKGSFHKVLNWMKSLTHGLGTADKLLALLLNPKGSVDLEAVINGLSNNAWNVGIGDAVTNGMVGPMRDASMTTGGFATPQTFASSFGLEYLRGIVPDSILDAAGGQLLDDETGDPLHSMEVKMTYSHIPGPGDYNVSDLTDAQLLAMVNQELLRNTRWAVNAMERFKGNHKALLAEMRSNNVDFRVTPMGGVLMRFRGG